MAQAIVRREVVVSLEVSGQEAQALLVAVDATLQIPEIPDDLRDVLQGLLEEFQQVGVAQLGADAAPPEPPLHQELQASGQQATKEPALVVPVPAPVPAMSASENNILAAMRNGDLKVDMEYTGSQGVTEPPRTRDQEAEALRHWR